ncbi:MAG: tRNA pseudouridine(55) synthase TruB [Bacteroidetes bacterium]|jgi:tRNA pseudouridine55 synthase|nr:tRNA pseudouridine(55) synthase TruB [Bacteroidota bacterium]
MLFSEFILKPDLDFAAGEVLLIDKPLTWTSFNVVNKIRHSIKNHPTFTRDGVKLKAKVGHAGTLDPLATGLLIICTGKKTKEIDSYQGQEKEYTGTFYIGATTPCFDKEKEIDFTFPTEHITETLIRETAQQFVGVQQQTPPVFSAIWVDGKRSYDLARAGEEVELKSREIEIKSFEIEQISMPEISFRIVCSKGTYIRSIARDFGLALNSGAHLSSLRRERIGIFDVKDALSL